MNNTRSLTFYLQSVNKNAKSEEMVLWDKIKGKSRLLVQQSKLKKKKFRIV